MITQGTMATLVATILVVGVSPARAQHPMPKPAPEMAALKVFDGSWTCEGYVPAGPMGPGGKTKGTVKSGTDLGGFWQSGIVKSSMANMPEFEGEFHMTYDAANKNYVMLWVDNMGGWARATSSGWQSDTILFTGDSFMGGKRLGSRDTFVKSSDGSLMHKAALQMDGKWASMGDETCKK
jgi:hypothetical protein